MPFGTPILPLSMNLKLQMKYTTNSKPIWKKKFSYETESQQILNKLIEAAKAEKYYDTAKEQIAALENDFTHSIDRDMDLFKDEITSFLTEQFIQRYYYLQGVIEYKVQHDQEVAKAVEVLNDKEVYRNTLKPVK